ncbi:restriction endonuclease subunit S [Variovorax rhizosphaerae]|uniref:Restriction endonuclease subunit S n=1 Tax=Variovorax rhizosphaerae TaxID=1836200 RepID=A0ABU8WQ49_9BURK
MFSLSVGMPTSIPPQGWRWVSLSKVARLESGHTPSRRHPEWWGGDIPWIGIRDATRNHGATLLDTEQHTNELGIANSSARVLPAHTVCLSRTASVGYVVVMGRPMATSQDFVNWVCTPALDHRFLKYILLSEHKSMLRFASGTTHQTIYFPEAKAFHVCIPEVKQQFAISDALQALDDRIALLHESNSTLEAIAQAMFKSWFVDFDPVRAKQQGIAPTGMDEVTAALFPDDFEQSELGMVPKGWAYDSLKDVVSIFDSQRVPLAGQERAKRQGIYPYFGAAALMDHVDSYLFDGIFLLTGEDGSVADSNGLPVTQYVWGKIWVNNHAHVLQGKEGISTEHLLLAFRRMDIRPYITGAVQAKLSQANMWRIPFLRPTRAVAEVFGLMIAPLFEQIRQGTEEAKTLSALRDTLLPRLISGQLRIPDAETLTQ